jgi:hypothetical protein
VHRSADAVLGIVSAIESVENQNLRLFRRAPVVWRSLFLAIGIMLLIVGVECLLIDSATVFAAADSSASEFMDPSMPAGRTTKVVAPAEWMPWTLLSTGAIVVLYAVTLPKRWSHA